MRTPSPQRDTEPLLHATLALVEEFVALPAGAIIGCVTRCRDELHRAGVRSGLTTATVAMARQRLAQRAA